MMAGIFPLSPYRLAYGIVQYIPQRGTGGHPYHRRYRYYRLQGFRHMKAIPRGDAVEMFGIVHRFRRSTEAVAGMVPRHALHEKSADTVEDGASSKFEEFSRDNLIDEGDLQSA
jgi:SulP family sulfate permease